jgi:hypothetical protein
MARSGHPWSYVNGNWGRTAVASALILFSNQRQLRWCTHQRPESHKLSSPSLFLLFLLRRTTLRRNSTAAWLDECCGSSRHHGDMTPQAAHAPLGSVGMSSSKGVTAWAQAPPKQRWRGPITVGLDLGSLS